VVHVELGRRVKRLDGGVGDDSECTLVGIKGEVGEDIDLNKHGNPPQPATFKNVVAPSISLDEKDMPLKTLEDSLYEIDTKTNKRYPESGQFKNDMHGFVQSCKVATADIIAGGNYPPDIPPEDVLALHLYTRGELFSHMNRAFRDGDAEGMQLWHPIIWYIASAKRRVRSVVGIFFRGVGGIWKFANASAYLPGETITWGGFSSSSSDLRIAGKFLYGAQNPADAKGVIFKIWAKSGSPIEWCSYVPTEREHLFMPNSSFRVLNWYPATDTNLRRGIRSEGGNNKAFLLNCDDITQPVPLPRVKDDKSLDKLLQNNPVVLIEMEELSVEEEYVAEYEVADLDI